MESPAVASRSLESPTAAVLREKVTNIMHLPYPAGRSVRAMIHRVGLKKLYKPCMLYGGCRAPMLSELPDLQKGP